MTPTRLSTLWYRRLYVALFVVSIGYTILYLLQVTNIVDTSDSAQVDLIAAIGGALSAGASVALFILGKKVTSFIPSLAAYGIFALTTAYLVQSSGGVASPFLALWVLAVFAAPIFGAYGWLPILAIVGSYIAAEYLKNGMSLETIILICASSTIPLIAGIVLWRETPDTEDQVHKNVKNLANQLSEVANRSEIVINAIGDGVIALDGKGVIQLINPAAQEILGWGKQDALMLNYKSILKLTDEHGNELDTTNDPVEQVLNTNQQTRGNKLTVLTNSGKKVSVSLVVSPIGEVGAGVIAVFRDVTNERAEEREQAEFISTASHEMRTPVASIEGYLGLALNPNTATIDEKARDFIMKAHESAQHLGRLFQDLLDVSKAEDGRMTTIPKVVDVVPFTKSLVEGLTQKATEKGLDLIFVPGQKSAVGQNSRKIMPVYFINLDNDHVREVIDNLIENAIKYTPQGEVRVDVTGTEDKVIVSIKDTGLGIPAEDIPHLFQKFYRVENMDRQSIGGTGLGLYLCRRLIENMQGRLWVESTFGSGSTFFIELPRIDTQEAEQLKQQQEAQAAQAAALQPSPAPIVPEVPAVQVPAPTSIPVTFADAPSTPPAPEPSAPAVPVPASAPTPAPTATPTAVTQPQPAPQVGATPTTPAMPQGTPTAPGAAPAPVSVTQTPQAPAQPLAPQQPITAAPAATAQPQPQPQQPLVQPQSPAPQVAPVPISAPATAPPAVRPATTVPRGETLTREQINERVRQLEALAQQQRAAGPPAR